jgi:hypothetical protein
MVSLSSCEAQRAWLQVVCVTIGARGFISFEVSDNGAALLGPQFVSCRMGGGDNLSPRLLGDELTCILCFLCAHQASTS